MRRGLIVQPLVQDVVVDVVEREASEIGGVKLKRSLAVRVLDVVEEFEKQRSVELRLSRCYHEEIVAAVFRHPVVGCCCCCRLIWSNHECCRPRAFLVVFW